MPWPIPVAYKNIQFIVDAKFGITIGRTSIIYPMDDVGSPYHGCYIWTWGIQYHPRHYSNRLIGIADYHTNRKFKTFDDNIIGGGRIICRALFV